MGALTDGGESGESMGDKIAAGVKSAALGIAYVLDKLTSISLAFRKVTLEVSTAFDSAINRTAEEYVTGLKEGEHSAYEIMQEARNAMRRAQGLIVNPNLGDNNFEQNLANLKDAGSEREASIEALRKEIERLAQAPTNADAVNKFFDDVKEKSDEAANARIFNKTGGGSLPFITRWVEQFQKGKEAASALKNPLEIFNESLERNAMFFQLGALNADQYARATARAVDELERANNVAPNRRAAALNRGGVEAQNAVNAFDADRRNDARRQNPQERVAQILADANLILEQQKVLQQQIVEALKAQKKPLIAQVP